VPDGQRHRAISVRQGTRVRREAVRRVVCIAIPNQPSPEPGLQSSACRGVPQPEMSGLVLREDRPLAGLAAPDRHISVPIWRSTHGLSRNLPAIELEEG